MFDIPPSLQRLADQVDGWLDLRCPDRAIELLGPMLDEPAGRPAGLVLRVRALARLGEFAKALPDLAELRRLEPSDEWIAATEAWCQKRTGDLRGAASTLERLLQLQPRSHLAHFNLGCYLALLGERERAIDEVTLACGLDDAYRDFARDDPDLDGLRTDERFRALLREARRTADPGDAAAADDEEDDDDEGGHPPAPSAWRN